MQSFNLSSNALKKFDAFTSFLIRLPSFVFFFWFSVFLVQFSDRNIPATLSEEKVLTDHITPGQSMIVSFRVDRTKVCRVIYNQIIYDSSHTRFTMSNYVALNFARHVKQNDILRLNVNIPKAMAKGPAVYFSERQYICNWTQQIFPLYAENNPLEFNVE